jgi:hypothetical protein
VDERRINRIVITHKGSYYMLRVEYDQGASDVHDADNQDDIAAIRDQYLAQDPDAPVEYRGVKPF